MSDSPGVIILGIEYQALGLLRQLSSEGIPCVLIDQDRWGSALFSRYRKKYHKSPPYQSKEFWPWLESLARLENYQGWVIIPTDDEQVRQLAENLEEVQSLFRYAGLPWDSYQHIYNKRLSYSLARKIGIALPNTFLPKQLNTISAGSSLNFPFIIKPAFKREFSKYSKKKALLIETSHQFQELLDEITQFVPIEELIYQELIPGGGENQWSYCGFFINGKPVAAFTACRRRQKPPDFGRSSTYVIALYDEEIEKESLKLLSYLNYTGLAEVEWKRSSKDGVLKFLEINARCWGWHSLASRVVGNIPKMLYDYLVEGKLQAVQPKYGARWIKWITDIPVCLHIFSRGELEIQEYLNSLKGDLISCDWDSSDPMPFFLQFALIPYLYYKRGY